MLMRTNIEQLCKESEALDQLIEKSARFFVAAHKGTDEEGQRFCIECGRVAALKAGDVIVELTGHPEKRLAYQADALGAAFERIHLYA
jgi:hypothetical protein